MTEVEWTEHMVKDFDELDAEIQREVFQTVEKLDEEGINIEEVDKASRKDLGLEVWRLKVKNEKADHRIIFDIINEKIVLIAVGHRDEIYETESWKAISKRIKQI